MQACVSGQRHPFGLYDRGNEAEIGLALDGGVIGPVGEVHSGASGAHIVFNHPGHRWDLAIPGPRRVVGMTVGARAFEYREGIRIDLSSGEHRAHNGRCARAQGMDERRGCG